MSEDEIESAKYEYVEYISFNRKIVKPNVLTEVPTLYHVCFNSISYNIDRFNNSFHSSRDKELKKNLSFLQRFHSKKITTILVERSGNSVLDKRYFDFLINEYLKELDFRFFEAEDLNYILEVLLPKMGDSLEIVTFFFHHTVHASLEAVKKMRPEQYWKRVIRHLPNVKTLRFGVFSTCDDSTMQVIYASCKELKELCIARSHITSAGLKILCPEDKRESPLHLQTLEVVSTKDCDEGVSYLMKNLPSLECITYKNLLDVLHAMHADDLHNNALHTVPKYNLKSLHIHAAKNTHRNMESFEDTLLIASELCPRVSKISAEGIMTEKQLQILSRFSDLNDVSIEGGDVSLDISDFLQHSGKKMRKLEVSSFKLAVSTLVENCPKLESLRVGNIVHISEKEKSGNILKNLRHLTFNNIDENDSAEMFVQLLLDCCPNLDELQFSGCFYEQEMSDVIQKYCENSQTLENLTFELSNIDEVLLQRIVLTCTPLKKLVIDLCRNIKSRVIQNLRDIIRSSSSGVVIDFYNHTGENDIDDEDLDDVVDEDEDNLEDDEQMDVSDNGEDDVSDHYNDD